MNGISIYVRRRAADVVALCLCADGASGAPIRSAVGFDQHDFAFDHAPGLDCAPTRSGRFLAAFHYPHFTLPAEAAYMQRISPAMSAMISRALLSRVLVYADMLKEDDAEIGRRDLGAVLADRAPRQRLPMSRHASKYIIYFATCHASMRRDASFKIDII